MKRCVLFLISLFWTSFAFCQLPVRCEYWFDKNHSQRQWVDFTGSVLQAEFETEGLSTGIHTLNLHLQDSLGWCPPVSYIFLKLNTISDADTLADITYKCWFDRDYSTLRSGSVGSDIVLLDVDDVSEGIHTMSVMVERAGEVSYLGNFIFLRLSDALSSDSSTSITYKCWFDNDFASAQSGDVANGNILLETGSLETGLHTMSVMVKRAGEVSYIASYTFLKFDYAFSPDDVASATYTCWFDNDFASAQSGPVGNGNILLETNSIETGLHTLNLMVEVNGVQANLSSYTFLKFDYAFSPDDVASATYTCWFDNDFASAQSGPVGNGNILLETNSIETGLHTLNLMVEVNGVQANLSSYMFLKPDNGLSDGVSGDALSFSYWFDRDYSSRRTGQLQNGNVILETDSLPAGIHSVNIQVNNSTPSALSRHIFFKEPIGGLGVCKYEYWLNEDFSSRTAVEVNPPSADFEIVSLMPMDTVAFNPMSMYFDVNEGNPIVYGENDIHFRFWNNLDFFTDTVKRYVDMTVSRFVIADTIERNTTELIPTPTADDIHWFMLHSEIGDSIAFKADKGCALQLYDPSGERVMVSSGIDVLDWNSLTSLEGGWYHLAVSNGSANNPNLNVSYFRLGKFDVVDYDVDRVGNDGYTNINYVGNGFDSLNTVMYISSLNDTITHVQIGHETNNHTSVLFNFSGTDTGVYRAVFVFNDYVLTIDSALTIETARDIILTSNVDFPESFLRGSKVQYTVTITNTGNMTASNVPFYTYIGTPGRIDTIMMSGNVSFIRYGGLDLPKIDEDVYYGDLPENEANEIRNWANNWDKEHGDLAHFFLSETNDEETGEEVTVRSNYHYITLAPYETKTLELEIKANDNVEVWITIPDTIPPIYIPNPNEPEPDPSNPNLSWRDQFCCVKDKVDCIIDAVSTDFDLASTLSGVFAPGTPVATITSVANCIFSMFNFAYSNIGARLCPNQVNDLITEGLNTVKAPLSLASMGIGCFSAMMNALGINVIAGGGTRALEQITCLLSGANIATTSFSCTESFGRKNSDCLPQPRKGGRSNSVYPIDPNEIYGYVAQSGSMAVGSEVEELFYTIQFENDTMLATSSASNVYLIDSLDSDLFDLSSFGARKVIIGSKEITLNGEKEFVRTMDMRPDINCLAQISLTFDSVNGVSSWAFSTLDPITLEEINIPSRGFLPVNYYGEGIGEVMFTINRKNNLVDSTLIPNHATIIFDNNEGINTSIWQNVVDVTPPQSSVSNITITDTMALLTVQATDNISGVWKYDVFAQYGANAEWEKVGENIPIDSMISVRVYDGMNTGFVSIAIDSAGNMENKPLLRDNDIFALHVYSETNEMQGYVNGLGSYDSLSVVELTAVANACYQFVSWNDGNTDNPRSFTLTKDTTFTALFEEIEFNTPISATICEGSVYTENNFNVSEAGVYTQNLQTINGCDSTVTLTLTVNPVATTALQASICEGTTYTENGFNVSEAGVYTQNLQTINGCDSTVTLTLVVNPVATTNLTASICEGTAYTENGFNVSEAGVYTQNLQTINGCDSTVTLSLSVNPVATTNLTAAICEGTAYTENGFNVSEAGVYTQNLQTINGCDSIVTLTLTVNPVATTALQASICQGETYTENGFNVSQTGVYTQNLQTINGCDSTVTLTLTGNPGATPALQAAIC
ncbi:MAG: hypothetical protein MR791_06635, partial [Bacteroidales bacterium]|nr:hypothetical protein [Bacteroidales bacterium]